LYNAAEFAAAFELWFLPGCDLRMLFDASHNTCEMHVVDRKCRELFVHRKGATRAFGPGHESLPRPLRSIGQPVRDDCDGSALRLLAWQSRDPDPTRRLLALAEIYDGVPRSEAARAGGAGVQIVRDWVLRFNAEAAGH